ncbi:MAG TPA: cohesin domain-containing protein, partial [Bacteroidales bacterium]|nr:cohesin domain-containing protein [Bacteroidales bacterium]
MSRFLLFLISLMLSFASLTAQEDFMSNRDNPQAILPQLTADPNSTVSVPLTINNMSKVKSLSVIYTFDPQILTYSSSSISGGVLTASMYNYLIEVIDGNKIKFTFNAKNTLFMYTGSGLVGTINFETGSYGTSPLIFTEILINTVTYLGNTINGEVHITPCYTAIADAGPDASITVGQIYLLNGNATNHSSVEWATQGDGVFSNTNILKPYYTPGSQDIANGGVSLCLTANGFSPCGGTTDCMYLSILPEGTGAFGMLPNLYADPGSTVIIPVQAHLLKSVTNLNITISYDSKILTYSNFDFNNSVLTNSLYNREFNFIAPGLVQFNFQCKSPAFTYTGSGVVGNIIFAVGNFGISPLVFEEFTINNDNNTELCVNGQVYVSDCFNAVAFAGANQTICEDETATLNGSANYYQSLKWVTTGDGSFSDITSQNTIYTPGAQDISAGNVELCLIAYTNTPCMNDTSCLQLSIAQIPEVTLEPFDEYCEGDEPFTLTGGSPEGGVYYVDGQEADTFDPSLAGTYNILYVYTNEYGCTGSATEQIIVNPTPDVTLEPFDEYCEGDEPFTLTGGSPEGGVYYVDGQEADTFDPSLAGTYNILYVYINEYGCTGSATEQIIVNPLPIVTCPDDLQICINTSPFVITGAEPSGGIYSGNGVEDGFFHPEVAGLGEHEITYNYEDLNGCSGMCSFIIIVAPLPTVDAGEDATICQDGSGYQLNGSVENAQSFFWYTLMGTGDFDNQNVLNPIYTPGPGDYIIGSVELCLNAISEPPCDEDITDCMTLYFYPKPVITCPPDLSVCIDEDPFLLSGASPEGGYYSGPGVLNNIFDPQSAGAGNHQITYINIDSNGCLGECTFTVSVVPLPTVDAGEDATICQDGSGYQLNGSVENAQSFFWYTLMGTGDFDNQNVLNPIYTPGPGDYIIGSVELCLNAISEPPCDEDITDCMTLYFYPKPVITCPPDLSVCIDEDPFLLSGASPEGGYYSGPGVLNNIFDPQLAGAGNHQITYDYIDYNACPAQCTFHITVNPLPEFDCPEYGPFCQGDPAIVF